MKKKNRVAFFNILSTLLLRGISIFTAPVFSRLLGTNGYGVMSVYTNWVNISAIAGTMQTQGTLVNARVEYSEEEQPKYQSSVMSLSLSVFLACSMIILLFLGPIAGALQLERFLIPLILVQAFGAFCVNFLNTKFTYEMKAGRNMVISVAVTLTTLVMSIVLILLMPKETNYYGRIFGNAIPYGVLGFVICGAILAKGRTFYNAKYWRFCLSLTLPVMLWNLSDLLLGHSDVLMLKLLNGNDASGIYSYAFGLGGVMFTIFGALNNSWVPFYFEDMKNGRREDIQRQAKNFLELYTVLAMGFVLLVREVFYFYARQDFRPGTGLIPVFVASYYLNFLCTFPVNFEYFHKKVNVVAAATISASLINIGLNYIFIKQMGMYGAAVATLVSHTLQFALHHVYTRFVLGKRDYPFGFRLWSVYALAFGAAVAVFYLLPGMWLLRWGVGAVIGLWELWRIKKRKVLI